MFLRVSLLSVLSALPASQQASEHGSPMDPAGARASAEVGERGLPAVFSWADFDGDGRLDLAAVSAGGALQLLVGAGDGRFEDVTARLGLSGVNGSALAAWADYDRDGRMDLFVGASRGASHLFHNEGGAFVDMSAGSGLSSEGSVQAAQWLDYDGDERLDLVLVETGGSELFHGLEGGFFERVDLSLAGARSAPASIVVPGALRPADAPDQAVRGATTGGPDRGARSFAPLVRAPGSGGTSALAVATSCLDSIRDQASPGSCLEASTTPAFGRLYPLSLNLFVAASGNVGIGTNTPAFRLDVAGTARVLGTLSLASEPSLDVFASIRQNGTLFIHTKGSPGNTALGLEALSSVNGFSNTATGFRALLADTSGSYNCAHGAYALNANTTGDLNVAIGDQAMQLNTTGTRNTGTGSDALHDNTTGSFNTACGADALSNSTTADENTAVGRLALGLDTTGAGNTAVGLEALSLNSTGSRNIALGRLAGSQLTTGNDNIDIGNIGNAAESGTIRIGTFGTQTRTFIAGIRPVTTGIANAIPVLIDGAGQLGTISSSRRFKKDISDMGDRTARLLELRPVVFHYKQEQTLPDGSEPPLEYGLIAEEVAELFPELVVYDDEGQPMTVKYHLLSSMLLNELEKLHARVEEQAEHLRGLEARLDALEARAAAAPDSK